MPEAPPAEVLAALLGPTTRVIRRVEIYEQDGVTRWNADQKIRFVEGTVNMDYSRDERASLDLTMDNSDGALINAPGEFWYDKVIKAFRGVEVRQKDRPPKVIIIGGPPDVIVNFRSALVASGFDNVRVNTLASDIIDLSGYEIVVSLGGLSRFPNADLLAQAYSIGYTIFTQGAGTDETDVPFITAYESLAGNTDWHIEPNRNFPHDITTGWVEEFWPMTDPASFTIPTAFDTSTAWPVSGDDTEGYPIIAAESDNGLGGKWVHFQPELPEIITSNQQTLFGIIFKWLNPFVPIATWEVQIGEFMIDRISEAHFPRQVKVTGRDYTKKCMNSKYVVATQFDPPNQLDELIRDIAIAAGITKYVLPPTGVTVTQAVVAEKNQTRWDVMKKLANSYAYDIYFDGQGYLRLAAQSDPATSPPAFTFQTGKFGNLASYEKSTDDSRLYNHVLVTGGASDDNTQLPPWAEAKNENPNSPTSIQEIGDRLMPYDLTYITTTEQAQAVADAFLAVHQLEQFDLSFESIILPWLEVGTIIQWIDPRPAPGDPDMFLLTSINIPLGLGTMSCTAARVSLV